MKKIIFLIALMLSACIQHKPVESLSFDEMKVIVDQCTANGKVETDDYCKQVAYVYTNEVEKRKNDEHQKKWQNHNSIPKAPF